MRKKYYLYVLIGALSIFTSCQRTKDNVIPTVQTQYKHGAFILNEGNFKEADGSISFYSKDSNNVTQKVFERENGRTLAGIVQSMHVNVDKGYVVLNNPSKIEIVNLLDFKAASAPITTDLNVPRYLVVVGSKAYISNWGDYDQNFNLNESYIAVLDLNTFTIIKKIPTASGPEGMLVIDSKVYIANSFTNVISILDTAKDEITQTLQVEAKPTQMVLDVQNKIWAVCTSGALVKIDPSQEIVEKTVMLNTDEPTGKMAINTTKDKIYFMTNKWADDFSFSDNIVYSFDCNSEISSPILTRKNLYGLGLDPVDNLIYVADANGFQSNGTVIRYKLNGTEVDNFPVGRGPNGFYFVE